MQANMRETGNSLQKRIPDTNKNVNIDALR